MKHALKNLFYPICGLILFLLIWWIIALIMNMELLLPRPYTVFLTFIKQLGDTAFYSSILNSLLRSLASFLISLVFAIIFGVIAGASKSFERFFAPIVVVLRATPTMSIILLSLVWMTSAKAPILIGFLISFPLLYVGVLDSIRKIDITLLEMAKVYKTPQKQIISKLYIPNIFLSNRGVVINTISLSFKIVVAAEVLALTANSLGIIMQQAKINIDTALLLAYTVSAILISFLLELFIVLIYKIGGRHYGYNY